MTTTAANNEVGQLSAANSNDSLSTIDHGDIDFDDGPNIDNDILSVSDDLADMLEEVERLKKTQSQMMVALTDDLEGMIVEASARNRENIKMIQTESATEGEEEEDVGSLRSSLSGSRSSLSAKFHKSKARGRGDGEERPDYSQQLEDEMREDWMEEEEEESREGVVHNIKVIVVGDAGVGKTSLIHQLTRKKFNKQVMPTLGVDYSAKNLAGPDMANIRLNLWDVAGQERYRVLSRAYLRGCQAAVVVFDVTRPETLEKVDVWKKDIDLKCGPIPSLLLGNKQDLGSKVTDHQLDQTKNILNFTAATFTSATKFHPLEELIREFATKALLKMEADSRAAVEEGEEVTTGQGLVDLTSRASKGGKGGCDSMC